MLRLGALGDVVRTLPAVSSLRRAYPGAHIAWLVEPPAASILREQPWIDEVLVFPRPALRGALRRCQLRTLLRALVPFLRALRGRRFDLVVDFHSILRSGVLSALSGAGQRVAYARPYGRELSPLCATHRARLAPERRSRFARNAGLVDYLVPGAQPASTPLRLDPAVRLRARRRLGAGPPRVAIHPGTSDATPYKRYTVEGYARVARALAKDEGVELLVTWGPAGDERAVAERIVEAAAGAARLAPPTPTLSDLAALFAACRLTIGSDTGPLHLAALVGTPVVQIFGPTDPIENAPYAATPSRSVRVPVPCSPCRRGCAAATCMRSIPPAAVIAASRELLAPRPTAGVRARAVGS
ncbi:MAG: glycosyltransferase family 9 protein [Myxococcota bacterium]